MMGEEYFVTIFRCSEGRDENLRESMYGRDSDKG